MIEKIKKFEEIRRNRFDELIDYLEGIVRDVPWYVLGDIVIDSGEYITVLGSSGGWFYVSLTQEGISGMVEDYGSSAYISEESFRRFKRKIEEKLNEKITKILDVHPERI